MNQDLLRLEEDMEKDLPPFVEALRSVRLTHAEKDRMLGAILSAPPSHSFSLFFTLRQTLALSVVVTVLAGSTASYAAQSALPGEFLYPIKVRVNEKVRVALARSNQDKARVEAMLAQRRLEEGETLAERGQLTDETRAEIALRFHDHARRANERFAALADSEEADTAVELSTNFEATLNAHEAMLARFIREEDYPNAIVNGLLSEVRGMARVARKTRVLAREKVRIIADAGKMREATSAIREMDNEQDDQSSENASASVEATDKLSVAEDALRVIEDHIDEGTEGAFDSVSSALSLAQDAGMMMKNMKLMNMDSEDASPATDPMAQIRASAQINVLGVRIDGARKLLEKRKEGLTEEEVHQANIQLTLADTALLNARAKMETAQYDEAKTIADEGIAIIVKARRIIKRQPPDDEGNADEGEQSSAETTTSVETQSYTSIGTDGSSIKVQQKIESTVETISH